ncbi:prolactin-inducible protein homolog [Oryx dammah]|uniref:prolactin-inducible protein homolog n=1 Tax=Oryx dammah TaxID=59534 RepID=UPI001A9AB549|nr:prolactin-inducible protein homolog [Oryx dammah]
MRALQLLFKISPAALLLGLFLTLWTVPTQGQTQNIISITLTVERVGNSDDYIVTLTVTSHVPVYLVVKATLEGSDDANFPYGNFVYTACLCPYCSKNFFWDINGPANGILIGKAEVVSEENICPSDVEISTPVYKVCIKREINTL